MGIAQEYYIGILSLYNKGFLCNLRLIVALQSDS